MKLALSVADLPLNIPLEDQLMLAKELKLDGIEILPGLKSIPTSKIYKLCSKYKIPILSVHLPFWIMKHMISTESVFKMAGEKKAIVVAHPLVKLPLDSSKQQVFMQKLDFLSKKYSVKASIENMPKKSTIPIYKYFSHFHPLSADLTSIYNVSKKNGLGITIDTTHLEIEKISSINKVKNIIKNVINIHISDFDYDKQHLRLGAGKLDVYDLMNLLKKCRYDRLVTLEVSPKVYYSQKKYIDEIRSSIKMLKTFF